MKHRPSCISFFFLVIYSCGDGVKFAFVLGKVWATQIQRRNQSLWGVRLACGRCDELTYSIRAHSGGYPGVDIRRGGTSFDIHDHDTGSLQLTFFESESVFDVHRLLVDDVVSITRAFAGRAVFPEKEKEMNNLLKGKINSNISADVIDRV